MGNKYPKIKLDLNREEEQKLQKLKSLKKFTSLPETFHYLLHSRTVLGNSKDALTAFKVFFVKNQETVFPSSTNELSEQQNLVLFSFQVGLQEKAKTENQKRKTYDIFPGDRMLVDKIKKEVKVLFGKSVSDTVVFKTLLSRLSIPNELSNEECIQYLETFKQKLNDVSSFCWELKEKFFVDDIIEKYRKELEEEFKKSLYTEQISVIDLYIDIATEQINYAIEMISKK